MPATISISKSALYKAMGDFIVSLFSLDAAHVIQGYPNRTPMPVGPFVVMTIMNTKRLRTNISRLPPDMDPTTTAAEQGTQVDMQLDVYGPLSGDWAEILSTLLRDEVGCIALAPNCQPLYADDPIRAPLVDAELQYEDRWIVQAKIQFNPITTTGRQYADALGPVGIVNVDVEYGP